MVAVYPVCICECVHICVCEKMAGNKVSKPKAKCTNGRCNSFADGAVPARTVAAGGLSAVLRCVVHRGCASVSGGGTVVGVRWWGHVDRLHGWRRFARAGPHVAVEEL